MRQIRYGTFETNSSSTHSIVVSKNILKPEDANFWPSFNLDGKHPYDFGRCQLDMYDHWDDKLAYILVALCEKGYKRKVIKEFEKRVIKLFYKVLNGERLLYEKETPEYAIKMIKKVLNNSYIDHGYAVPREFLDKCLTDDDFLISFLFNIDESYVAVGGDEYGGYYIKRLGFQYDYHDGGGAWVDKNGNEVEVDWEKDHATEGLDYKDKGTFWDKLEEYKADHYVYLKGN